MAVRGLMCTYALVLVLFPGPCYITFVSKNVDFFFPLDVLSERF